MTRHRDPEPKPKAEALRALEGVENTLLSDAPLDGLSRRQLAAAVTYAAECVEAIVEVKRIRRPVREEPKEPPSAGA